MESSPGIESSCSIPKEEDLVLLEDILLWLGTLRTDIKLSTVCTFRNGSLTSTGGDLCCWRLRSLSENLAMCEDSIATGEGTSGGRSVMNDSASLA